MCSDDSRRHCDHSVRKPASLPQVVVRRFRHAAVVAYRSEPAGVLMPRSWQETLVGPEVEYATNAPLTNCFVPSSVQGTTAPTVGCCCPCRP